MIRNQVPDRRTRSTLWFRQITLMLILMVLSAGKQTAWSQDTNSGKPPENNLLVITVDDMNRDSIGWYGCPIHNITPNIDRLAERGVSFDRAYVNIAICQPCRAVWLTGRYPHRNGALGFDPINPDVPTLPERLHELGYFNAVLGKNSHTLPSRPNAFDVRQSRNDLGIGRSPEKYAAAIESVVQQARQLERPFFIMANAHDPHRPFAGSNQEQYRPRPEVTRTITPAQAVVPEFLPDLPPVRKELAEYFTSVHRADQTVGAIIDKIEELGLMDSTLILFMSDHGMPLPFAKTNCYPASNQIPWIILRPGEKRPGYRDTSHFVSGIDVTPTLLDFLGQASLDDSDGKSILPLLEGQSQEGRDRVLTMINRTWGGNEYPMRAWTTPTHVYIWNGWSDGQTVFRNESQSGRTMRAMKQAAETDPQMAQRVDLFLKRVPEELYQWQQDPACRTNLVNRESTQTTLRELRQELRQILQATQDPARQLWEEQVQIPRP